jgi:hypothetical protein
MGRPILSKNGLSAAAAGSVPSMAVAPVATIPDSSARRLTGSIMALPPSRPRRTNARPAQGEAMA